MQLIPPDSESCGDVFAENFDDSMPKLEYENFYELWAPLRKAWDLWLNLVEKGDLFGDLDPKKRTKQQIWIIDVHTLCGRFFLALFSFYLQVRFGNFLIILNFIPQNFKQIAEVLAKHSY